MRKSFLRLLSTLIFTILVILLLNWNTVSAYSTDAETQGVILYVKPGANGNCTSWADACELQTALFNAVAGDQIWVAAGTYKPSSSNRSATFQLKTGVAIYGGFPAVGGEWETRNWEINTTTLSGDIGILNDNADNSYHVVTGSGVDATTILDGFIVSNGYANGNEPNHVGGGMYNSFYSSPTLTNITFSDNIAGFEGGGMYNESYSSPRLTNVTFSNNTAVHGGGIYNSWSSPTLTNVTFSGNSADSSGGAMGLYYGSPTLTNVTFSGNTAYDNGGGISNIASNPTLTNVTFIANIAGSGGGIHTYYDTGNPTLRNSIFWGNVPDQINGPATVSYSNIQGGYEGIGNIDSDPLLGDLSDNGGLTQTYALSTGSPAIDNGDNEGCSGFDQRNYFRPTDGDGDGIAVCDMGAYEYESTPVAFELTIDVVGNGLVNLSPEKLTYTYGEQITLTAIADPTWSFVGWNDPTRNTINPLTIAINGDTHITANFSQSVTLYVKPGANGSCESWETACELQTALFNANPGDQVWVATGTYKPTTSSNRFATFQMKSGVAVFGGFPATGGTWDERDWSTNITTLSGDIGVPDDKSDNSYHVVTANGVDNTAILAGFTITGGNAEYYDYVDFSSNGGGMIILDGSLELTDLTFTNNSATEGGGIFSVGSRPTLTNVTFTDNSGGGGGGMANIGSSPTLNNVTFTGNISMYVGGGMYNNYGSNPTITEATFSDNFADYAGAGMYNGLNSSPTLNNVTFDGNIATSQSRSTRGGGMYNYNTSEPTLINVTFISNSASYGGGMYNDYSGIPILTNVNFINNTAGSGGGMHNENSNPILTNVSFSGNNGRAMYNRLGSSPTLTNVTFTSNYDGGMLNRGYSNPNLINVTFSGNTAYSGAGIYNYDNSSPILTNVTFSGNIASDLGGGMKTEYGSPTLINVTFWGNSASRGGGIYNYYSTPTISNTILWGNSPNQIYNFSSSPLVTYSDIQGGYSGTGNINANPLLGALADNGGFTQTHSLDAGSPAIDTGNTAVCPGIDQREYRRPIDGDNNGTAVCDMGAFEFDSYPAVFSLIVNVAGNGSVSTNPEKTEYKYGDEVFVTPAADPNWVFNGWSGDVSGMDNPLVITIGKDTNITANFAYYLSTLSVSVTPEFSGSVSLNPDLPTYPTRSQVTLTAQANPGWSFAGWSGDASSLENPLTFMILGDTNIIATYSQDEYTLSVAAFPENFGSVTIDPEQATYHYGDQITLTAVASAEYSFSNWSGDVSGFINPLPVTILGNTSISANFNCSLTVSVNPETSGVVLRSPNQASYSYGTQVILTAVPNPGWTFAGWTGDASGSTNPLTISLINNTNITAYFTQDEYSLTVLKSPSGKGSVTISPSKPNYHYGEEVTLTAFSSITGWRFIGWSGDGTGTDNPKIVTIQGNTNITANFSDQYTLTTMIDPLDAGTLTRNINQGTYTYGTQVALTAIPATGWAFSGWSGDASGAENPLTVTIEADTSINATFTQNEYTLTVTPIGSGTVTIEPVKATYHYGDVVTLTASADPGWTFNGWGGNASGSENPLTYTIAGDTTITATFTQDEYSLTINPIGSGTVVVEPVQDTYHYGDLISLTPTADPGWTFDGWGGDGSGSDNPLTYTIVGDTSITATFTQNEYTLVVNVEPVGSGTVNISPMLTTYHYGDEVTLTPIANPGWTFSEWTGDVNGSDNPLTLTIHGDTNITANFTQEQYTLDVTIEGFGSVLIEPSQATYTYGTEVTLTATADSSWSFAGWSDDASGSDNPLIFTIQGNTNITALFTTNWIFLPMITR